MKLAQWFLKHDKFTVWSIMVKDFMTIPKTGDERVNKYGGIIFILILVFAVIAICLHWY